MDRKSSAVATHKRRRRLALLWSAAVAIVVIVLLVQEQVAVLYVLATLSVTALLMIVAWSDLGGARLAANEPPPFDNAAAIADGKSTSVSTTFGSTAPRAIKRR